MAKVKWIAHKHNVFVAEDAARFFIEENESTESGLIHSAPF